MPEPVEDLYPQIGQAVIAALPAAWSAAWVTVELKPGLASLQGHYLAQAGGAPVSFRVPRQVMLLFSQLHQRMVETEQADWKKARIDLQSSGKFELKFEY